MVNYCKCGCGTEIADDKVWSHGHNSRGDNNPGKTLEAREKNSLSKMGDKNPMKNPKLREERSEFMKTQTGKKGRNWQGGKEQLIPNVRLFYDNKCSICHEEQSGKHAIPVHHIDGNNRNNVFSNLITLCKKHHQIVHQDMEYYKMALNLNKNVDTKEMI